MGNRDDFPAKIRSAVALRAGYRCSICYRPTVGPSEETSSSITMIGEAAHIHAAAGGPGARRHLTSMAPEERSGIGNAIWLCANHARVIDRDQTTYSAEALHNIKQKHETKCAFDLREENTIMPVVSGLIALGPNVICIGKIIGGDATHWRIHIERFVEGNISDILDLVERFFSFDDYDRYVVVNSIGDGRVLSDAPSWSQEEDFHIVICSIFPTFPRIKAQELGTDLALSENNDLTILNGDLATVSGLGALAQKIRLTLSFQRGESSFHKNYGTRIAAYYELLGGSFWFDQLVKLEVVRMAAIPYPSVISGTRNTPFACVDLVFDAVVSGVKSESGWIPIVVDLSVNNFGKWKHELLINIRSLSPPPTMDNIIDGDF